MVRTYRLNDHFQLQLNTKIHAEHKRIIHQLIAKYRGAKECTNLSAQPCIQGAQQSVKFQLDGKLAVGISNKVHKCQLSVAIKTYPELHMDTSAPLMCNKYIETFYGSFTDTCSYQGNLKLSMNVLDISWNDACIL